MKTLLVTVATLTALARPAPAQNEGLESLLRLHHTQRVAHVLGDAERLVSAFDSGFTEVSGGAVGRPSAAAARERFEAYLGGVRFLEWEDVRPPRVRLAPPDGAWAEVLVQKRVRTVPSDTTRSKRDLAATFAWVERWVHTTAGWRLATIASTDRAPEDATPATLADRVRAYEILRRARGALGGEGDVARVGTLRFVAACEGPRGPYEMEVASARDGRVAFVQRFPTRPRFGAGVSLDGAWTLTGQEVAAQDTLDGVLQSVVSAHEFHLLAIAPEARYAAPAAEARQSVGGTEVDVVRFADRLGAPVEFLYDAATGRPAGFRPVNHTGRGTGEIFAEFADWRPVSDVRLPFRITITQDEDVYRCRVTGSSVDWIADDRFRAEAYRYGERTGPPARGLRRRTGFR